MRIEINRLEVLAAAKKAARVAPSATLLEVLNGILIESNDDTGDVYMTATNHEQSIQMKLKASVSGSGAALIKPRLLVGMLSLLDGEFVTLSADKPEVVTVTGGACKYEVNCLPAKHFPKPSLPFPEETAKLSGICSLAKRTVFAVSTNEHKPALQCVSIRLRNNSVLAAACDGARLMLVKDAADSPDERELLLPGRSLQMLASISTDSDEFEVGDVGNEVVFTKSNLVFSMRKLPGEYIDTMAILKNISPAYVAAADSSKLKEALELLSVAAENEPVNLALTGGNVILRRGGDYSEAQSVIAASVSKATPDAGFWYSIENLRKLFQVITGRVRLELDAKGIMLVKTKSEVYMELPRREPVAKAEKADEEAKLAA